MVKFIKKWRASEFGMKIREKFYPGFDPNPHISPKKMLINSMKRYEECDSKKSLSQIKQEITVCRKFWRCFPHHYYLYDLYREDKQVSEEELINYIPDFFWYYLYLPHHTSYKYSLLTDNKIITEHIFGGLTIPQPVSLCKVIRGRIYSPEMMCLSFNALRMALENNNNNNKIFVKPAESGQGKGIYIFHKSNDRSRYYSEKTCLNQTFLEMIGKNKDYIIQQGINQHPEISSLYPESVNTIRIITENNQGDVRIPCAMMRIGRGKNEIDNASAGGIFLKIAINSGNVGDFAFSYTGEKYSHHPDSKCIFRNFKIPLWDEILRFAKGSAGKLPFFTHLAWDIALTDTGPVAIEINLSPGISGLQISSGGLRDVFGIEDPGYYWKNPGRRREYYS
jgi:hypothetical protein